MCVLSKRNQSANNTRLKRSTRQVSKEFHNIGVGSADDRDEGSNNRRETSESDDENLIRAEQPPGAAPAVADVPGVPGWFAPAMAAALAPIQGQLNNVQGRLSNVEARQVYVVASDLADPLRGISNAAGIIFPNFPNTLQALLNMTGVQMTQFLTHYGLGAGGTNTDKMHRIKKFIGLRIA